MSLGALALLASLIMAFVATSGIDNPSVQEYYGSLESRFGYRLLLGTTRHCGLYKKGQMSPFPISPVLRAMKEKLYPRLALKPGSKVLDDGAGSGYVAMYMAQRGLNVQAIDITPHHLADARKNVEKNKLEGNVSVIYADYHNLSAFSNASFERSYTMETFVHADDPAKVLDNFLRLLKPGGVIVLHEADFSENSQSLQEVLRLSHCQNTLGDGVYEKLLADAGLKNIRSRT